MKTIVEKLNTLEYRVRQIGVNKTNSTRRSKEDYKNDLIQIPALINELTEDIKSLSPSINTEISNNRLNLAKSSFKYWS